MYPNNTTQDIPYGYCQCGCGQLAPIASHTIHKKGHIKGQPTRYALGHRARLPLLDRFWTKVVKRGPDDCWLWLAGKDKDGYGKFWYEGKTIRAHRFSYELCYGLIPEEYGCFHDCDFPSCVNPHHLFSGLDQANVEDRVQKERSAKGEKSGPSRLTSDQVIAIRERYVLGETQPSLANAFGIGQSTVSSIIRRQTWAHIT